MVKLESFFNSMGLYFIGMMDSDDDSDNHIARILGIQFDKYKDILQNLNGFEFEFESGYYFKNKSDCEKAIEVLEPYVIMAILTEE